ncbi:MAG TPA: LysR family transcriptional regulator, partial [Ktedonobacteraceae bacterium]|nr:LysR family transcriptional regulator [Ktedonobacteraceae bacterium]
AERLYIAQPPLSQQIQNLELELGVPLLVRTRRSVHLTAAGRAFLEEARKVIAQAERAVEVAHQAHDGVLGQVAIGLVSSALAEAGPSILTIFRKRFPHVEIKLSTLGTAEQVQALRNGEMHVGLLHPPITDASLELEIIRREPLFVVLPAEHALTSQESIGLAQLSEEDFVMFPRNWSPGTFDQFTSLCRAAGFQMRLGQEARGMDAVTSLVATGFGVALVPASSQYLHRAGVMYRPLWETTPTMDLAVAWCSEKCTPVTQHFLQIAREIA